MVGNAFSEATGKGPEKKKAKNDVSDKDVVVRAPATSGSFT